MQADQKKTVVKHHVSSVQSSYIGTKEASLFLGYSSNYLYNLVNRGQIQFYKAGGRKKGTLKFLKSDLIQFMEGRINGSR